MNYKALKLAKKSQETCLFGVLFHLKVDNEQFFSFLLQFEACASADIKHRDLDLRSKDDLMVVDAKKLGLGWTGTYTSLPIIFSKYSSAIVQLQ